eukprot:6202189-Pleurochrysis_carterae.AAC.2
MSSSSDYNAIFARCSFGRSEKIDPFLRVSLKSRRCFSPQVVASGLRAVPASDYEEGRAPS